ncbi:MAG: putative porin [Mucilaginibacter sp.]
MGYKQLKYLLLLLICVCAHTAFAQFTNPGFGNGAGAQNQNPFTRDTVRKPQVQLTGDQLLDTLRKQEEGRHDSVEFSSKMIRVTNERLLNDSTQVFPLDTGITDFENYSLLYKPKTPKISLGGTGFAARSLLFEPSRTIGFDVGLHALDVYLLSPQDIQYYRARVPITILSLVTGGKTEQIFKIIHTQNIKPNWNVGFNLNFAGSKGFYSYTVLGQNVSQLNAAVFTWYESKNKRYNLLANLNFNNLKSPETGSILKDTIFTGTPSIDKSTEAVRLPYTYENWKTSGFYVKQFYYIGRIDTLRQKDAANILPTQRVAYTLNYNVQKYNFIQNDPDTYGVFPDYYYGINRSRDSLTVQHIQNDFSYSFYLRGKSNKFVKNEFKLDLGLTHDLYTYSQFVSDSTVNQGGVKIKQMDQKRGSTFQNITLKARFSYRFSDKVGLEGNFNQIAAGRNFGDFLYDAKLLLAGSRKAGKIILGGYVQSSSPGLVYTDWVSNHYIFHNTFKNQKTTSVSFNYMNDAVQVDLKAEYFLISDYLYFASPAGGNDATPQQLGSPINLFKLSLGKNLTYHKWHFDNFVVYEKSDYQNTLRIPEVYTYTSLYYNTFLFNVLHTSLGTNIRFNTSYLAPSYAVGLGQFYNGNNITFSSYPIATVFIKATLQRTNLFVGYDYVNQGIFSKGYYTVNRYPQQDRQLKFGVSWTFFN